MPDIQITALDGSSFSAYLSLPVGGNGPGLLVIHEIFGLTDEARAACDAFAAQGYVALCPDLFWRQKDAAPAPSSWEQAARFYKNFDVEAGVRDLLGSLAHLRKTSGCSGKVGVVGSCLGGRLAFLMASRSDVDCAVGYYGVGIDSYLDEVHDIRMPFLLHLAEQDKLFPPPAQEKLKRAFSRNPVLSVRAYPNADHGFARSGDPRFLPEDAAKAAQETDAFLKEHLQT